MTWQSSILEYSNPMLGGLFPAQRSFVYDASKRKAALCGRRAGKTECGGAWLVDGCVRRPGSINPYIALSQKSARRILWPTLKKIASRFKIPFEFSEQTMTATHANGSSIWVTGCPDVSQCEDFRGSPYGRVLIDEAGSFPEWIEYLIEDVLDPALMDLDGELAMVGSPGLTPLGYFFERSDGENKWKTHHWTCLDNPHVPGAAYLERKKRDNAWADDHPTYVREYLGRWVRDESALVYPFDPLRNVGTMPENDNAHVVRCLAVDPGWDDPTGFVVGAMQVGQPEVWIERAWRRPKLTVAGIAAQIEQARHDMRVDFVVVDQGGLGKTIAQSLQETHGIPCEPAEKSAKQTAIHEFRGALLSGQIKIAPLACQQLREEWTTCAWNEDRDDHDERCPDDLCDPSLYLFRKLRPIYRPEPETPKEGTREWHEQWKAQRIREHQRKHGRIPRVG